MPRKYTADERGIRMSLRRTSFLAEPVDAASIAVFRVLFGMIMAWEIWRYFDYDWIRRYYIEPAFHFTYFGFSWVAPWSRVGMYVHFVVLGVLALCIAAGLFYRLATVVFFLGFTYVFLLEQTRYLNHFYLVSLISLLMVFVPAHRTLSLDARFRPSLRSETVPRWSLWLLRFQLFIPYFYGGIAKMNADWLRGEPARMWLSERTNFCLMGRFLPIGRWFDDEWFVYAYAYGGLIFDLAVVPMLLCRRTRVLAVVLTIVFHLANHSLFRLGIFPWFMLAALLLFLPPEWPRRVFNWPRHSSESDVAKPVRSMSKSALALLAAYVAFQVLVPFRHFLYPGVVHWTEEGHQFSWHMKLRDKDSRARFEVHDPTSGEIRKIDLKKHLSSWQIRKMSGDPDKVLQFAHYLARKSREEGRPDVAVYATVEASVNGRPRQFLVDPKVDLARQSRSIRPEPWIVPLEQWPHRSN